MNGRLRRMYYRTLVTNSISSNYIESDIYFIVSARYALYIMRKMTKNYTFRQEKMHFLYNSMICNKIKGAKFSLPFLPHIKRVEVIYLGYLVAGMQTLCCQHLLQLATGVAFQVGKHALLV